jgi:uncharacterized protein with HEPN domain
LRAYCDGKTKNDFVHDRTLKLVVHKLIEIVGEALHQAELLEPNVTGQIPDLRLIVDTRNRITHGYESVDYGVLWDIVQNHVPVLESILATILDDAAIDYES